jgi:hypothetical protein
MGSSNFPHNPSAAAADIPAEFEEAEAPSAEELLVLVRSFSLVVSPSPETFHPRKIFLIASKKQQGYRQMLLLERKRETSAAAEVGICKRCSVKKKKKNWGFLLV